VIFSGYKTDACNKKNLMLRSNRLTTDAVPPHEFSGIEKVGVDPTNVVFLNKPSPGWIAIDDCVTMDCDGPKHVLLRDIDGSLLSGQAGGAILAAAEFKNDNAFGYKAPQKLLTTNDGTLRKEADVIQRYGIPRDGCTWNAGWNAYSCPGGNGTLQHRMLIMESLDHDTEERSLVPVAVTHTASQTTDLMNGGQDHGWCMGYTCLKRLSTFYGIFAMQSYYEVTYAGTNPKDMSYHMLSESEDDMVVIKIWYSSPMRLVIYVDGQQVDDLNYIGDKHRCKALNLDCNSYTNRYPSVTPVSGCPECTAYGANAFDDSLKYLHLLIKGSKRVTIKTFEVIKVSMTLGFVSENDFYDVNGFVERLAAFLNILPAQISRVDIIAGRRSGNLLAISDRRSVQRQVVFDYQEDVCANGVHDTFVDTATTMYFESDVDCGGSCNSTCVTDKKCHLNSDCTDKLCSVQCGYAPYPSCGTNVVGTCKAPSCTDSVQNGDESDTDCGGSCTMKCSTAKKCAVPADCNSGICSSGICQAPTCFDTAANGLESDLNCGGSSCPGCASDKTCNSGADCESQVCVDSKCLAATCSDGMQNQLETDIDCAGPCSAKCAKGKVCKMWSDCTTGACAGGNCVDPSCSDGVKNGDEVDSDCGGSCDKCVDGLVCANGNDCVSGVCTNSTCQAPTCQDSVKNGNETHTDCGGQCPNQCAAGQGCSQNADCQTKLCTSTTNGICMEATCNDGEVNGNEASVDCGGYCTKCADNDACNAASDCQSGVCESGTCAPASCEDSVANGDEVGTAAACREAGVTCQADCGGVGCGTDKRCPESHYCTANTDCASELCYLGECLNALCADQNIDEAANGRAAESDVIFDCSNGNTCGSCGGGCLPCPDEFKCNVATDCASQVCGADGKCAAPTCSDGKRNGNEVTADCGGGCRCAAGQACAASNDCQSLNCVGGKCLAPTCTDGIKNREETDIDCGDTICPRCAGNRTCTSAGNCADSVCQHGYCQNATCSDGVKNGLELDTDCGHAAGCGLCNPLQNCVNDTDCTSSLCLNSACTTPSCSDDRQNAGESDVDCGGPCGATCKEGKACSVNGDCTTGLQCNSVNKTCENVPVVQESSAFAISSQITASAESGALGNALGATVEQIEAYSKAAQPMIEATSGDTADLLTITSASSNVKDFSIVYTTDGTDPACPPGTAVPQASQVGTTYNALSKYSITEVVTIKAIACADEMTPSGIITRQFTEVRTAQPIFNMSGTYTATVRISVPYDSDQAGFKMLYAFNTGAACTTDSDCGSSNGVPNVCVPNVDSGKSCESKPSCPSTGTQISHPHVLSLSSSGILQAISCTDSKSESLVTKQRVQLTLLDPQILQLPGLPTTVQLHTTQTAQAGYQIRYSVIDDVLSAAADPVCPDSGTIYNKPFTLLQHSTVKAVACAPNFYGSNIVNKAILAAMSPPKASLERQSNLPYLLTLTSLTNLTFGFNIRYNMGPTEVATPDCNATTGFVLYNSASKPLISTPQYVKAVACGASVNASQVTSLHYTRMSAPNITGQELQYSATVTVSHRDAAAYQGFELRYTTNGSDPVCFDSPTYLSTLAFSETTTVKVIACAVGYLPSTVMTSTVTVQAAAPQLTFTTDSLPYVVSLTSSSSQLTDFHMRFVMSLSQEPQDPTCSGSVSTYNRTASVSNAMMLYNSSNKPATATALILKAIACGSLLNSSEVVRWNVSVAQPPSLSLLSQPAVSSSGVDGFAAATSLVISSVHPNNRIVYTTDKSEPSCFDQSALTYSASSKPIVYQSGAARARVCGAPYLPSPVSALNHTLQAQEPTPSLSSSATTHTLQFLVNMEATNYRILYAIAQTCGAAVAVSCGNATANISAVDSGEGVGTLSGLTSTVTLENGVWPLFHTGSAFTACVKAVACGDLVLPSSLVEYPVSVAGEAPEITHKVKSKLEISGYTKASFDDNAKTAFKGGIAQHAGVSSDRVIIGDIVEKTTRRGTSLEIAFTIELQSANALAAISDILEEAQTNPATMQAVLQNSGMNSLTSMSVKELQMVIVQVTVTPTSNTTNVTVTVTPTATPTTTPVAPTTAPVVRGTIVQDIQIPLAVSAYVGVAKKTYEYAWADAVSLAEGGQIKATAAVTSSASRRSATVTFNAQIYSAAAASIAATAAQALDAATFASKVNEARLTLGTAASVPEVSASDFQVSAPHISMTSQAGPSSGANSNVWIYILVGVGTALMMVVVIYFLMVRQNSRLREEHGKEGGDKSTQVLVHELGSCDREVRNAACEALKKTPQSEVETHVEKLLRLAQADDAGVRAQVCEVLACMNEPQISMHVVPLLPHPNWKLRKCALIVLSQLHAEDMILYLPAIAKALKDTEADVRQSALHTMSKLPAEELTQHTRDILHLVQDSTYFVQRSATELLKTMPILAVENIRDELEAMAVSQNLSETTRSLASEVLGCQPSRPCTPVIPYNYQETGTTVRRNSAMSTRSAGDLHIENVDGATPPPPTPPETSSEVPGMGRSRLPAPPWHLQAPPPDLSIQVSPIRAPQPLPPVRLHSELEPGVSPELPGKGWV